MTRDLRRRIGAAALAVACAVVLAACSNGVTAASFTVTPTTVSGVTVSTEASPSGRILSTANGRTLYDFTPDTSSHSACTSGLCVRLWPPLLSTGTPRVGRGLIQGLAGTIRRPDGRLQVTYGGHPLYTWIGDTVPGMITGQAILNVGGYWYVIAPTGHEVKAGFRVTKTAIVKAAEGPSARRAGT